MKASLPLAFASSLAFSVASPAAQIALYPTGPAQDSAYMRLLNPSASALALQPDGGQSQLQLQAGQLSSDFMPIPGGQRITGNLERDSHQARLHLQAAPGEFITVITLANAQGGIDPLIVHETFELPNMLKASLALFNADASCVEPQVKLAGHDLDLFAKAPAGNPRRQEINPRSGLSVQLQCAGKAVGAPQDLGPLLAGERYSLFLLPSPSGTQLRSITDNTAH
ncbi:cell division protein FtsQ [Pseudomonas kurunegalensis]|uniref:cell division protein FtsQ n=1 Tax=Pseudomonas kurunegalensis TaxID=485880 RepID=UPI00257026F8|nr:cell division protein FtsQ [Pseudomonas kurunegalensis]WJD60336.1 cell division protein FtsQ [Pseudomonas kurunegalensis]